MNHFQHKGNESGDFLAKGDQFEVVRERETVEDLIKGERVASCR